MRREAALASHLVGSLHFNIFEVADSDEGLGSLRTTATENATTQRGISSYTFLTSMLRETPTSKHFTLVSEVDDITIGFVSGCIIDKRCVITAIYVQEKCRSLGIGALLLTCAQQLETTVEETLVCVLPGQRELKNLCEQAGLPAQLIFAGTP